MKNIKEREDIIKFALMLNTTNLSPLRSGNLSIRVIENDVEGVLLTPSGIKYETLKPEDIVFLALDEKYDNLKMFNSGLNPSSEWRFHQDVYIKKEKQKQSFMLILHMQLQFQLMVNQFLHFIIWSL